MTAPSARSRFHRVLRIVFLSWAVVSTSWLASTFVTRGVDPALLGSSPAVRVENRAETLEFIPGASADRSALLFLAGSGVAAEAYAPLLRPLAEAGHPVVIVKLPWRFAPFERDKLAALERARRAMEARPEGTRWVVAGHSLGGALACRAVRAEPNAFAGLVLLGTTHPKSDDLSALALPVTKVYATHDGVAPAQRVLANRALLPARTTWIVIEGGNHSQFGHYGRQIQDGRATISREAQQARAREALADMLDAVEARP